MWNRAFISVVVISIALISGGCCCVDTCCNSSCDFGGEGCNQLCGTPAPQVLPASHGGSYGRFGGSSCGCDSGGPRRGNGGCSGCGGCSDNCGNSNCGGCGVFGGGLCGGGVFGYGGRNGCGWGCGQEVFIDGNGNPCYGPIMGLAAFLRDSFQSCGCSGELYVDEWVSDPPLCNDPCMECGESSCGSGGCGCDSVCSNQGRSQSGRNYNWNRTIAGKSSCGTCDQGYAGNSRNVVKPPRTAKSVANRRPPRKRTSIRSTIKQVSDQSPVKRWGDSVSQHLQTMDVQPSIRPPGLDSLGKQLRKSRTAAKSKVIPAGWFN